MTITLIVIAKEPLAGRVKTRLIPPLTPQQAADVAAAALCDTLDAASAAVARDRILAFAGRAGRWLPAGWLLSPQPTGSLDKRLAAAFLSAGRGPALLVGMDTPQLRPEHLAAFSPDRYDACLGMATDGGYWAIGLRDPRLAASAIEGVAMSRAHTGADQLRRLLGLGLRVQLLDELTDVDTMDNATEVAALVPNGSFARAVSRARGAALIDTAR